MPIKGKICHKNRFSRRILKGRGVEQKTAFGDFHIKILLNHKRIVPEMSLWKKRRQRKYEKQKNKVRRELSLHLFSVTAAEQNAPTHIKLRKNPSPKDIDEYLEHRMRLRKKWIDKFFEFHPDIDPKLRDDVREEAYQDMEAFKESLLAKIK